MIVLILSSIESDIINAYNSYKFIKAEVITFEYNTFYVDVHRGHMFVEKPRISGSGIVEYNFTNKYANYYLIDKKQRKITINMKYNETSILNCIIVKNDFPEHCQGFHYMLPYELLKYLLTNNIEHSISYKDNYIFINFNISQTVKIKAVLNKQDFSILNISYENFQSESGKIIFRNIYIEK